MVCDARSFYKNTVCLEIGHVRAPNVNYTKQGAREKSTGPDRVSSRFCCIRQRPTRSKRAAARTRNYYNGNDDGPAERARGRFTVDTVRKYYTITVVEPYLYNPPRLTRLVDDVCVCVKIGRGSSKERRSGRRRNGRRRTLVRESIGSR